MSEGDKDTERAGEGTAPEPETGAASGPSGGDGGAPEGGGAGEPAAAPEAGAEAAALKDQLLRALAELENFRRRAAKERQDTAKYAIAGFARDCLTVLDNLRRGLDAISAEERAASASLESLAAGMELTEREMMATLERHGITKIEPEGATFDPHLHQAMFEIETDDAAPGTVVQVMQAGYVLNGRLLRPALVGVAKAAAPAAGEPAPRVQAPIANEDLANSEPEPAPSPPRPGSGDAA